MNSFQIDEELLEETLENFDVGPLVCLWFQLYITLSLKERLALLVVVVAPKVTDLLSTSLGQALLHIYRCATPEQKTKIVCLASEYEVFGSFKDEENEPF